VNVKQQTVTVSSTPNVCIESIPGDLRVAGWDRPEIMVKTDGDEMNIASQVDPIVISCDEDLILYIPRATNLIVKKVAGDAILQAINGAVMIGPIAGDVTINDLGSVSTDVISGDASLRNIGALTAGTVIGDFALRGAHGACSVQKISGDASIRDVDGTLTIADVGSDLYIRKVQGAVNVKADSDVTLYLTPHSGQLNNVTAGGDLIVRLAPETSIRLHLEVASPDSIQVDFPGVEVPEDCTSCDVLIGDESEGMATMQLTAGGDLLVTSQADSWESAADFDKSGNWRNLQIPPIPPLPPDFSERINRRVQAAMRRAETKARAAEVRARGWRGRVVIGGRTVVNVTGSKPEVDPITDAERLTILKMLQDKKISIEQAEKLLAALEGK
jgi:hypothetical protein